jgi:hypothetical protein
MRILRIFLLLFLLASSVFGAELIGPLEMLPAATAGTAGIHLEDVVTNKTATRFREGSRRPRNSL